MKQSPTRRVFAYLGSRLVTFFAGVILFSLVWAIIVVAQAFLLKDMMNAIVAGSWVEVRTMGIMLAGFLLFDLAVRPGLWKWFMDCGPLATVDIRNQTMATVMRRPMSFFESSHSGDIISRINADIGAMQGLFDVRFRRFVTPLIHGVFISAAMCVLDWRFALILVILNTLSASFNLLFAKPIKTLSAGIQKSNGGLTGRAVDMLAGISCLKIFPIASQLFRDYAMESRTLAANQRRRSFLEGALDAMNTLLGYAGNLGAILLGTWFVSRGQMDIGTLLAFVSLQADLGRSFLEAAQYFPIVQKAFAGADRLFELIDGQPEPERHPYPPASAPDSSELALHGVSFGYLKDRPVLRDIDLRIGRGQVVALVGESGGGKTTLLKIILGFCQAQSGSLSILGRPYGEYSLDEIRQFCAWVPQEPYLFDGTIEENIRFGRAESTLEQLRAAAADANALEFIEKTPDGFSTRVGQGGLRLSGGQKQRIAIARAILKDAPILLLDEATSSLDSRSEQLVQEALVRLMRNRTSVVVAHRLSTIRHADVIHVIDSGRIVESGSHDALLTRNGVYCHLWDRLQN